MTSTCERTMLAEHAEDALKVLRTWRAGKRLPGRVTGQVVNPEQRRLIAGARVELRGPQGTRTSTTDSSGRFVFENVEAGRYEGTTEGGRLLPIDLNRGWCFEVVFLVK